MVAAVVLTLALALVFAAIVIYPTVKRRTTREPVAAGGARVVRESTSTGTVEVIATPVQPTPVPALFDEDLEPDVTAGPGPGEIRWAKQFDPRSVGLDDTARLRLIGDLGVVAKEWCVPLLAQAYQEERRPANRQAALIALAACRSRNAIPTYRLALESGDAAEGAIAKDALTDLEPFPQTKSRTVVERR